MVIAILEGFPDDVVAARAVGQVTRQDYASVLIPRVEVAARRHEKLRCYYEIGGDFTGMKAGAIWADLRIGVEYWTRWERVAVVTDHAWVKRAVNVFRFLMPGQARVYPTNEKAKACAWLEAP
jgi:hypothetical protein